MHLAEVLSQVLDLELALGASIEIQRVHKLSRCVFNMAVARLRILLAVGTNLKFTVRRIK